MKNDPERASIPAANTKKDAKENIKELEDSKDFFIVFPPFLIIIEVPVERLSIFHRRKILGFV